MAKSDWHHLYKTARWKRLRLAQLDAHPCCRMCDQQGRTVSATVVDHRIPHKGDLRLFHDPANLQSMCKDHHDSAKKLEESRGIAPGCSAAGWPIDPRHHWNQPPR